MGIVARGTGHAICLSGKPLTLALLLFLEGRLVEKQEIGGKRLGTGKPTGKLLKKIANCES